jgi:hypothetical protein
VPTQASEPSPEIFGDVTADDFVRNLNARIRRRNYAIPVAAGVSVAIAALWLLPSIAPDVPSTMSVAWPVVAAVGYLTSLLLGIQYLRSKHSTLLYDDCAETERRMVAFHKAVTAVRSAAIAWSVGDVSTTTEIAPRPSTLHRIKLGPDSLPLPHLRTNITPASMRLTNGTVYFFPDRLFIWHSGRFSAVDYRDLKLRAERVRFLERETQPPDAALAGSTRRSFNSDGLVPIVWYGIVDLDAAPAIKARLMTSRVESAEEFVEELQRVIGVGDVSEPRNDSVEPLYTHFDPSNVPLFYDLSASDIRRANAIREAFAAILQSEYVWRYEGEERTEDWKRNAGASTLIARTRVSPVLAAQMPGFETNAAVGIDLGNSTLYVLPDQCIIRVGNTYKFVGKVLRVQTKCCSFREEEATPHDSSIVGQTWRYVNKRGGPDLRFNDNHQIPIYRYGEILISVGESWRLHLCLSRAESAERFGDLLRSVRDDSGSQDAPPREPKNQLADAAGAFRLLGLPTGASFEDASVAYRNLARQNHPDKVAHLAPEFHELAERRMREINAAFDQIRLSFGQRQ